MQPLPSTRAALRTTASAALLLLVLACGGGTPLSSTQTDWAGKWVAADGTYVELFLDGGANYKGSNSNIEGGGLTLTADKLSVGLGPISSDFHIDAPPANVDGAWTITLDGVTYTRQ